VLAFQFIGALSFSWHKVCLIIRNHFKNGYLLSRLDVQDEKRSVAFKPVSLLVVSLGKALNKELLHLQGWLL